MTREPRALIALAALAVAGLVFNRCSAPPAEEVESETVVSVKTEAAAIGDIRGVVHATGVVTPAPGADLVVIAPEAARIAEVPKAVGDRVRRGDVLVRFEIPTTAAELQRQQAEVTRAQAAIDNARAAQKRAAELFERGVAARREVEDATRALADAEAALAEAQASRDAAQTVAARATVLATFDGIVEARHHNPGDLVESAAGDLVLRVIDPRRLEVVASVPLGDASRVAVGSAARLVTGSDDGHAIALKVLSHPIAVDAGTATVPVRLGFGAVANLPAGAPVQLEIDAERHTDVVLVPAAAIVREGDEAAVFVANGEKAERRLVTLGLRDGSHVEIASGVKAGEAVIVDGHAGLPDGAAIHVANDAGDSKEPAAGKKPPKGEAK